MSAPEPSRHWLTFGEGADGPITGCGCGFTASPDDYGWGDSVIDHIARIASTARDAALRALIEKWRTEERHTGIVAGSYAAGRIDSADELEQAIGGGRG